MFFFSSLELCAPPSLADKIEIEKKDICAQKILSTAGRIAFLYRALDDADPAICNTILKSIVEFRKEKIGLDGAGFSTVVAGQPGAISREMRTFALEWESLKLARKKGLNEDLQFIVWLTNDIVKKINKTIFFEPYFDSDLGRFKIGSRFPGGIAEFVPNKRAQDALIVKWIFAKARQEQA